MNRHFHWLVINQESKTGRLSGFNRDNKMIQVHSYKETETTESQDRILLEVGLKYAIGRDCEINVIEAHKWLNIAAIRGNAKAERMRNQLAVTMSKGELAAALRGAREWMTS